MNKGKYGVFIIGVVLSMIAFFVTEYIDHMPINVMETHNEPFPVSKVTYTYGEVVEYKVDICKHLPFEATVTYILEHFDQTKESPEMNTIRSNWPTGCSTIVSKQAVVPQDVAPGRYRVRVEIEYQHNTKDKTIPYNLYTEYFYVAAL